MPRLLDRALHSAAGDGFLAMLERLDSWRPNTVRVLTYHQIDDASLFDQQMRYLAANYQIVAIADLMHAFEGGQPLPARSVMISFDDAYSNFARCAWPVMRRYELPVVLFVPTAFPNPHTGASARPERHFWWDRLEQALDTPSRTDPLETPLGTFALATPSQRRQALKRLKSGLRACPHGEAIAITESICYQLGSPPPRPSVLSWPELRQLASEGVTLGAHTRTHPHLNFISVEAALAEALGSLEDLRREVGAVAPIFAYPGGQYNQAVVAGLREAGFALAFTTLRGANDVQTADRLQLRRNNLSERATLPALRARLLHASPYLQPLRNVTSTKLTGRSNDDD